MPDQEKSFSIISTETPEEIANDVFAISQIAAIPALLELLCEITGMGFAAVARVSNLSWTVCAVKDKINFGLKTADQLPIDSTLCIESRTSGEPIVFDHASSDPRYCTHDTPRQYKIESYISVPIVLSNGQHFGNLCAVDPKPAHVSSPIVVDLFKRFAALIALQVASISVAEPTDNSLEAGLGSSESRDRAINLIGDALERPISDISDASDTIDRQATDPSAVKGLATRIRTNALKLSSLVEELRVVSRQQDALGLRPSLYPHATPTANGSNLLPDGGHEQNCRTSLECMLMQRVGELNSHLGRYDMYALSVATWLEKRGSRTSQNEALTIRNRGSAIVTQLRLLAVPEAAVAEFSEIDGRLLSVLAEQDIAAHNAATIPALREPGLRSLRASDSERDWFDCADAPDSKVLFYIDAMERNIALVATLYIRMAGWAGRLSLLPCWK